MQVDRRRQLGLQQIDLFPDRIGDLDGIRARLPLDVHGDGGNTVVPGAGPSVLDVVIHLAEVPQLHRGAIAVGDHHLAERRRVAELPVGLERQGRERREPAEEPDRERLLNPQPSLRGNRLLFRYHLCAGF